MVYVVQNLAEAFENQFVRLAGAAGAANLPKCRGVVEESGRVDVIATFGWVPGRGRFGWIFGKGGVGEEEGMVGEEMMHLRE